MTTAALVAKYLAAAGTRYVFGYPGDPNIELLEAARVEGIEMVLGRREGTVGFMAEAYGMLAGGAPGVCISTLGPGSTALVNAVAAAHLDRVPMLAISGQVSSRLEPYFTHQVVDHDRLFSPISKWAVRLVPEAAGTVLRKALRTAVAERPGPVHITTNTNLLKEPAGDADLRLPPRAPAATALQVFSTGEAGDPVRRLNGARRPLIVAGAAAQRAGAMPQLLRLSELVGCPVVVSPMGKGVFPEDHPCFAGTLDMACNKLLWDLLAATDLILAVGFDPVELVKPWSVATPVIHIDAVPNTDQVYFADTELVGSIPDILDGLSDACTVEPRWSGRELEAHRSALRDAFYAGRVKGKLNPTDVVDAIVGAFPPEAIVTTDIGSHKLLVAQGWPARRPNSFLTSNGLSVMGFSLASAITAKLVHPDRPVVCTVGDGGFAMVQGEMRLASELGLGIVVVVFCDNSLNRIELKQLVRHYPSVLTRIEPTDLVKCAQSMECDGAHAETPAELEHILSCAAAGVDRPLVVEAKIDPSQYLSQF